MSSPAPHSKRVSRAFFVGSIAGGLAISVVLGICANVQILSGDPKAGQQLAGLALLPAVYAVIVMLVLWFRAWASIQDGQARTTPGKAVGFLFIPLFNFYWAFQVIWGFARDYNRYIKRHRSHIEQSGVDAQPLPERLFLVYVILSLTTWIPILGLILLLVNCVVGVVMILRICDAVNALVDASAYALDAPSSQHADRRRRLIGRRIGKVLRPIKTLLVAALVAWGVFAWWSLREARRAGNVLHDSMTAAWPEQAGPQAGTRLRLLNAAEDIEAGRFRAVTSSLGPIRPPTAEQRIAAERFFAKSRAARDRFLAVAAGAEVEEGGGADVGIVRDALARALQAAAKGDQAAVDAQVQLAQETLAQLDTLDAPGIVGSDADAVAALVAQIEPAFSLSRDLMTEGHAAAEKLVGRASGHFQAGEHRKAASLVNLAAGLLAVDSPVPDVGAMPDWFNALAQSPPESIAAPKAQALVELAEAMALSLSPSEVVAGLIERARRELDAGRSAEAHWWASVALGAMGMTDEAVAQTTDTTEQETPEQEPPE